MAAMARERDDKVSWIHKCCQSNLADALIDQFGNNHAEEAGITIGTGMRSQIGLLINSHWDFMFAGNSACGTLPPGHRCATSSFCHASRRLYMDRRRSSRLCQSSWWSSY